MCIKVYELDPVHFLSLPRLAWQACLEKTNVKLELLTDYDMLLMVEEGIRGGICHSIHRYAKANNKYMRNYDKNKESSYLQYLDANNLYGWAMSQNLPVNGFKWVKNTSKLDDAAYSDSKDLTKRTVADSILRNRAFNIAKDKKYDGCQRGLASMVYKFFDKKSAGSGAKHVNTKLATQNQQLAEEPHKLIIRKFEKRKVHAAFKDNIWGADLADMQLLNKYNKGIRCLLCVIDIFRKYAWVVSLKDKKGVSIVAAFQSILKQSNRKPNKVWVEKGSEFYNASFKRWLRDNDIVMYSSNNEGKSVVAERFIRT